MTEAKPKVSRYTTPPFVISYPHLFKAQKASEDKDAKAQFSLCAIWKPEIFGDGDKKLWAKMHAAIITSCAEAKWPGGAKFVPGEKAALVVKMVAADKTPKMETLAAALAEVHGFLQKKFPQTAKTAIRSGEDERPDAPGYGPGSLFANMRSEAPPGVVDLSKVTIHPREGNGDEIYPGAVCRATITVFAYPDGRKDNGGRGYSFGLGNVQKIKDGARIDSRVAAEDDFDEEIDGAFLDEGGGQEVEAEDEFG